MNHSILRWLTSGISQWDPDICHRISWKTSQASGLYSLVTEVDQPGTCGDIWNHHRKKKNYIYSVVWSLSNAQFILKRSLSCLFRHLIQIMPVSNNYFLICMKVYKSWMEQPINQSVITLDIRNFVKSQPLFDVHRQYV